MEIQTQFPLVANAKYRISNCKLKLHDPYKLPRAFCEIKIWLPYNTRIFNLLYTLSLPPLFHAEEAAKWRLVETSSEDSNSSFPSVNLISIRRPRRRKFDGNVEGARGENRTRMHCWWNVSIEHPGVRGRRGVKGGGLGGQALGPSRRRDGWRSCNRAKKDAQCSSNHWT